MLTFVIGLEYVLVILTQPLLVPILEPDTVLNLPPFGPTEPKVPLLAASAQPSHELPSKVEVVSLAVELVIEVVLALLVAQPSLTTRLKL